MWQSDLDQKRRESRSHAFERRLCGIAVGLILPGQWGGLVLVRRMRQPSLVRVVRCACNDRKYLVMPRFVHLQYRRMKFKKLSDFHGDLARIRASRKLYPAYPPCSRDAAHIRRGRSGVAGIWHPLPAPDQGNANNANSRSDHDYCSTSGGRISRSVFAWRADH